MELKNFFAQDDEGHVLPGADCYVYLRGTETQAPGVVNAGGVPVTNPFTAANDGLIQIAAPNGLYDLRVKQGERDRRIRVQFNDVTDTLLQAQRSAERAELASLLTEASKNLKPTIADGLRDTEEGGYFSVPSTSGASAVTLYRKVAGAASEQTSLPSGAADTRTINKSKAYPLRAMTRGQVLSPANVQWNKLFLDIQVVGEASLLEGKFFRVGYLQNEATINGVSAHGVVIEEFDAATYAATGTATNIHSFTDAPAPIVRTGGVQSFTMTPKQRPGLKFIITIDAAELSAAGTPMNALNSASSGPFSWIIDPACYVAISGLGDMLAINKGRVLPLRAKVRGGKSSSAPTTLMNVLLDIEVNGARPGKYYRVGYFKNGTQLLAGPDDGWIIEEIDAANYETQANPLLTVINFTDAATPVLPRGGIQTINLVSSVVLGLEIKITLDTDALPAYGTYVAANADFHPGYSYIIDPSRYRVRSTSHTGDDRPIEWVMTAAREFIMAWASENRCYRLTWTLNGINQIPNIRTVESAPGGSLADAVWQNMSTSNSDWLPPMQLMAAKNGDGGPVAFTGGAHGSDGGSGGAPTATNKLWQILADGVPVSQGSGRAQLITMQIINHLQAYNTKVSGREVGRQAFSIGIVPGCVEVVAAFTALEDVLVRRDYGLQLISNGFQGTQLVLDGVDTQRTEFVPADNLGSGTKAQAPNAWGVVLQHPINGQMALWMDKDYGAGDGSYCIDSEFLVRGAATGKWYLGAVLNPGGALFAAGNGYRYRAGLSWRSAGISANGYDSIVTMRRNGMETFCYVLPDGKSLIL
ncbi:hypothetical protein [Pseudomonas sp. URIL14HWK12:I5]|uniref:hypothetical protein n=1 Tax=Pseudomonas sp. URIL14HWK12:I5 TaxID=1261630 RepID=UPI0009D8D1EA|nr:hypothetical protein [Pseudomonas sp. URIL14HWK12:I5]SMD00453.1 hypothetical protein SAMN05660385_03653 [Pseudomonas sp. URIL14HWK12:I5]